LLGNEEEEEEEEEDKFYITLKIHSNDQKTTQTLI